MVEGFPRPLPVAVLENHRATMDTVTVRWPVAGTPIVHSSLYGAWMVEAFLDGEVSPCGPATTFRIVE